jgi:hypothetical protein
MKTKFFTLLLLAFLGWSTANAQVGIGTKTPNTNSILDLRSTEKGVLIPRMTTADRNALGTRLSTSADALEKGMQVFDTSLNALFFWDGTKWVNFSSKWALDASNVSTNLSFLSDGTTARPTGTQFVIKDDGKVGIGTSAPTQALDVNGTTKSNAYIFPNLVNDTSPIITAREVPANQGGTGGAKTELILFHNNDTSDPSGPDQITLRAPFLSFQTYTDFNVSGIDNDAGYNERMVVTPTGNVGIGTVTPSTKAVLDLSSNSRGLLIPRMTTAQRVGILPNNTTDLGLQVYDTTTASLWYWNGTAWVNAVSNTYTAGTSMNLSGNEFQRAALTGDVTAAVNSNTTTIADLAVTTAKLANNAVVSGKILDNAVTEVKIGTNAVTTTKIANSAVNSAKIADGTIASVDISNDAVTSAKIADANVTMPKIAQSGATSGQVIKWNGSAWAPAADLENNTTYTGSTSVTLSGTSFQRAALTGDVTAAANSNATIIANGAVNSAKIADGTIATVDIADLAVTTEKLANNAVVSGKILDNAVTTVKIGNNAVTTAKIANANVTADKLTAGAGTAGRVATADAAGVVTYAVPAAAGISTTLASANIIVGNGSNVASPVAMSGDVSISNTGATTIANNAVTTAKLADNAVTSAKIADNTITNADLADGVGGIYKGSGSLSAPTKVTQGAFEIEFAGAGDKIFSGTGKVGIGTASPTSTLQVTGAATNTTALNAGSGATIDFAQSNLARTSSTGSTITLNNIKDGGAYTLIFSSTGATGEVAFTVPTGFTPIYVGTVPRTNGKKHIYNFIVAGSEVYITMGTQN